MNTNLLFENEEVKNATERVLAAFKVKSLNEKIDELVADVLKYAKEMDDLLEKNNITKRFLDKVSMLSERDNISLDADLNELDFRIREVLEDLVKRLNTRLSLIRDNDSILKNIEDCYDLNDLDLEKEIKTAKLMREDFV